MVSKRPENGLDITRVLEGKRGEPGKDSPALGRARKARKELKIKHGRPVDSDETGKLGANPPGEAESSSDVTAEAPDEGAAEINEPTSTSKE